MTTHIKDLFDLSGRIAIVTGGSRGLGKEMAEGLAEAGASLMLCARRAQWLWPTVEEIREKGTSLEGVIGGLFPQQRLLDYIVPDFVHVLYNGRIVKSGKKDLALELEKKGYDWLKEEITA